MAEILSDKGLDLIFRAARSHNAWLDEPVGDTLLNAVYDLMKMAPTSANCCPARILFLKSKQAKERIKPHLDEGNVNKVMTAPVCAIIGYDTEFYEKLPQLFPHNPDAKNWLADNETLAQSTAFRNGSLQGAYFIIAARSLGLDCGPMSGFDNDGVDRTFFPGGKVKSNFICSLGYGEASALHPRGPRLPFDEACRIL